MRITYDPEADALYIRLVEGVLQCRNVQLNCDVTLHFGEGEVLVGIEILDAKSILGGGNPPTVQVKNLAAVQA